MRYSTFYILVAICLSACAGEVFYFRDNETTGGVRQEFHNAADWQRASEAAANARLESINRENIPVADEVVVVLPTQLQMRESASNWAWENMSPNAFEAAVNTTQYWFYILGESVKRSNLFKKVSIAQSENIDRVGQDSKFIIWFTLDKQCLCPGAYMAYITHIGNDELTELAPPDDTSKDSIKAYKHLIESIKEYVVASKNHLQAY